MVSSSLDIPMIKKREYCLSMTRAQSPLVLHITRIYKQVLHLHPLDTLLLELHQDSTSILAVTLRSLNPEIVR